MSLVLEIGRLQQRDLFGGFSAGPAYPPLDEFLLRYAKKHHHRRFSTTYLARCDGALAGYVTILPGSVRTDDLAGAGGSLPKPSVPVLVLARMAVDMRFQRKGVGLQMLARVVLPEAVKLAESHGCIGVAVDATDSAAVAFYARAGFATYASTGPGTSTRMFLPMRSIQRV